MAAPPSVVPVALTTSAPLAHPLPPRRRAAWTRRWRQRGATSCTPSRRTGSTPGRCARSRQAHLSPPACAVARAPPARGPGSSQTSHARKKLAPWAPRPAPPPTVSSPSSVAHHYPPAPTPWPQNLSPEQYEAEKERVADELCARMEAVWPGLRGAIEFREVRAALGARGACAWRARGRRGGVPHGLIAALRFLHAGAMRPTAACASCRARRASCVCLHTAGVWQQQPHACCHAHQ